MAQLNAGIVLGGQSPDIMGAFDRGQQTGARQNAIGQQNALAQLYQTQGAGIASGDQNALNALAQIDPMASLGVQGQRQGMQATQQRMDMLSREEQRQIQSHAAQLSAAERAAEAQRIEQSVAMGLAAQSPQEWDAMMQQTAPDLVGQFDNRSALANRFMSIADILKRQETPDPLSPEGKFAVDQSRGLIPQGTPSGAGDEDGKARAIRRTMEATGVDYATAQGVIDGILKVSQDPTTREIMVTNLVTSETYAPTVVQSMPNQGQQRQPQVQQEQGQQPAPQQGLTFGQAFEGAQDSFGVQGVGRNLANTIGDATGLGVPFPRDQQTRQDFEVLAESLVNDFASAYGRQPPSWLLQNIKDLVPAPGRVFEGPQRAQTKLVSIARDMEMRKQAAEASLRRRMTPAERQEAQALIAGIDMTLTRINAALQGFEGQGGGQSGNRTSSGVSWSIEE